MPSPLTSSPDVLNIGAGTAGSIAAIQAARAGAETLVVEMGTQMGGVLTTGGVSYPGLFHAWGRQVIAGIGWEMVLAAVNLDSGSLPDFSVIPPRHSMHQVRVNGPLYAALIEEAAVRAGAHVCYGEFPVSVEETPDGWRVETMGKGVRRDIHCRQIIDCTGGADVVGMLGLPRLREDIIQPGTLMLGFGGYDVSALDRDLIQARYEQALAQGRLQPGDYCHAGSPFINFLAGGGGNANHVFNADASDAVAATRTNIAGRAQALRLLRFIRSLPGCEAARITHMQPETAVRETYRIVGETLITREDYVTGRVFPDAVCHAFYPIDVHDETGCVPEPLAEGVVPTVPLGALIPKGSRNLLVAGRSLSSDRLANSALRVQATCMATGQAAGACAALAAKAGVSPGEVPFDELTALLRKHGAVVP